MGAVAEFLITVNAGITRRTTARVRSLAGIETGTAVSARLVIGTVIQVLIAEQATPAFDAQTFPRFLALAVQTARVLFAFVAQATFPSAVTSVTRQKMGKNYN